MIDLMSAGITYFILFIVGGYALLVCSLLVIRFLKRIAHSENNEDK